MVCRIALALIACSLAFAQRPNRRALFRELDAHVGIAMTRSASLSGKDRKKLDRAREVVRDAVDVTGPGRPRRPEIHSAFNDIEKRTKRFQEDDRKTVLADLRQLRALGVDRQPPRRPRPYRPWPGPRFPRRPRIYI